MRHESERLILREWREDDAKDLFEYGRDPRVGPPTGWAVHKDIEDCRRILKTVLMTPENYAIEIKESSGNRLIGCIGIMFSEFSNLVVGDDECEIGYWLGAPYWGRGIMPEAVGLILKYAFTDLKMNKVWCGYFDGNLQSKRVAEKCGFVYDHTDKDIFWQPLNEIKTLHNYYLTKKMWEKLIVLNN